MQFLIGDKALVPRLTFPQNRDFVLARSGEMAVQAIVGDVGLSSHEPLREGGTPIEYFGPFLEPVDLALGYFAPERFGVLLGTPVKVEIAVHSLDVGVADKLVARWIDGRSAHRLGL